MKKILITLALLLLPTLAEAQTSRNPCYNTTGQTGLPNCIGVGTATPLPVTGTISAGTTSNASSGVATSATNVPTTSYNYWFNGTTWDQAKSDAGTAGAAMTVPKGNGNLATAQVSVGTGSTATVAARALRASVTITNITGTQPIFCTSGTATLVNGQFIPGVAGASFTFPYNGIVNCIASTSAQTVSVTETY